MVALTEEVESRRTWSFDFAEDQWQHDVLAELIGDDGARHAAEGPGGTARPALPGPGSPVQPSLTSAALTQPSRRPAKTS